MTQTDRIAAEAVCAGSTPPWSAAGCAPRPGSRSSRATAPTATTLFAAADRALYEAKQAGKNRFRFAPDPA